MDTTPPWERKKTRDAVIDLAGILGQLTEVNLQQMSALLQIGLAVDALREQRLEAANALLEQSAKTAAEAMDKNAGAYADILSLLDDMGGSDA